MLDNALKHSIKLQVESISESLAKGLKSRDGVTWQRPPRNFDNVDAARLAQSIVTGYMQHYTPDPDINIEDIRASVYNETLEYIYEVM